jgi:hypothetical protein
LTQETYPPARLVAPKAHDHFAKHIRAAQLRGQNPIAAVPSADVIERMINATFWASLRREEGYVPKISMAFLPPDQDESPLLVHQPLPLTPATLTKIAAIVEPAGIHLGVWEYDGQLCIWGTTHNIPTFCFVLEVIEPGLMVIKHHRGEQTGKYVNVAVLEGAQIKFVDETASSLPDCPELVTSLLGFDSPASWVDSVNILVQLAVAMRRHGRGGLLLVVPSNDESWRESNRASGGVRRVAPVPGVDRAAERDARGTSSGDLEGGAPRDGAVDRRAHRGGRRRRHDRPVRNPRVRRQDSAPPRRGARGEREGDRTGPGWSAVDVRGRAAGRHAAPLGRAVRARSAERESPWSRHRIGASPCSHGLRARRPCTRTG